jgi:hypothetical protein
METRRALLKVAEGRQETPGLKAYGVQDGMVHEGGSNDAGRELLLVVRAGGGLGW